MKIIDWLTTGDLAIAYQAKRDLLNLNEDLDKLKQRILFEGFGKRLMDLQDVNSFMWGRGIYSPKYISTHYTLLQLSQLEADLSDQRCVKSVLLLLDNMWAKDGKVKPYRHQDACIVAMMLRFASESMITDLRINEMVDYILRITMADGGWNCCWERKPKPTQSSLHTTLSVLDSWSSYIHYGYTYRIDEIKASIQPAANYILSKHLFRSVRTGEIIEPSMLKFPFPYGWRYDILRALDCLRKLDVPYDPRMEEALDLLEQRFRRNGCLLTDSPLPRARHFRYDKTGKPNRFNTLRALRIFKKYRYQIYETMMDMSINDV